MPNSNPKTKLELTWIGKNQRPRLELRILLEDPALSYHATHRVLDNDLFDSRVIFGDNLLALEVLEQEFTGWYAAMPVVILAGSFPRNRC